MIKSLFKKTTYLFFSVLALACLLPPNAQAALHIELTQGLKQAIPLGISGFALDPNDSANNQTLKTIISNDLQNSGEFAIKTENEPSNTVDLTAWRKQKVNYLLRVDVQAIGGNQYQVNMQLLSVYGQANQASPALIEQGFKVDRNGVRALAHHISDLVYQKLTGIRGLFSTKVAYVLVRHQAPGRSQYTLEVADADGYNPRRLLTSSQPIMSPAWSPDGKQLAYVSFEGHRAAIYLQDLNSGRRSVLSRFSGINGAPAFSPNGEKLALVLTRTDHPKIYIMDLASKKIAQLTHGYSIDTEPSWSPAGDSLLFTSNRGGSPQIYRYTFNNQKINRLTYQGNYNARATFTPNGQAVVLMHRDKHLFSIACQNLIDGQLRILTPAGDEESPSLAPNGKMVVYATQNGAESILAMVSTDGRVKLRLPARQGNVQEPAWSPFLTT